jgi:hypothetical protein
MVNPHHPEPNSLPRLDWEDKWALFARSRKPGYRELLESVVQAEQAMHR